MYKIETAPDPEWWSKPDDGKQQKCNKLLAQEDANDVQEERNKIIRSELDYSMRSTTSLTVHAYCYVV